MKKAFLIAMFCLAGSVGQAAYLYWQVDTSDYESFFIAAKVLSTTQPDVKGPNGRISSGSDLSIVDPMSGVTIPGAVMVAPGKDVYAIDVSSFASGGYSFYIELINYDSSGKLTSIAQSGPMTYQALVDQHYIIADTGISIPTASLAWHGGAYAPGPEPTSAVMMLIGVAFLGLKRRRI